MVDCIKPSKLAAFALYSAFLLLHDQLVPLKPVHNHNGPSIYTVLITFSVKECTQQPEWLLSDHHVYLVYLTHIHAHTLESDLSFIQFSLWKVHQTWMFVHTTLYCWTLSPSVSATWETKLISASLTDIRVTTCICTYNI